MLRFLQQPLVEVEMQKLKPCPVCGNHQLKFVINVMTTRTCVVCEECGEESNWCNTKNEAIELWNRRVDNEVN